MGASDATRHWPVLAWIRLRLPEPPAPLLLTAGPPPPPSPPLDELEPEAVATDPTVRLYSLTEPLGGGALRLAWQAQEPGVLVAEYRAPDYLSRLPPPVVREFWAAVRAHTSVLGPLRVERADPYPG